MLTGLIRADLELIHILETLRNSSSETALGCASGRPLTFLAICEVSQDEPSSC